MGRQIIKVARDVDLYMEWSSIVESPTFIGTRAECLAYLQEPKDEFDRTTIAKPEAVETRLQRADETGSSGYRPWGCTWDDEGEIFEQRGYLRRDKMEAFARVLLDNPDVEGEPDDKHWAQLMALLEPFEDETKVRSKR